VIQGLRQKKPDCFYEESSGLQAAHWDWMEQTLRLMALTHDLGHPPFSHAGEDLLPQKHEHEEYTRAIILGTEIGSIMDRIGQKFCEKHGADKFPIITAQMVVDTYLGKQILKNDQHILNFLMDSELDCDKMDYLLRDSYYCGVNYGHYDLERLLSAIDIGTAPDDDAVKVIAVHEDGLHAFEEFVLARYFMFLQVYFHKTRRILDMSLQRYLKKILPKGYYPKPESISKYLAWDDDRVLQSMLKNKNSEEVRHFTERRFPRMIYQTSAHPDAGEWEKYLKVKAELAKSSLCSIDECFEDDASKLPHNIPSIALSDEKGVYLLKKDGRTTNIKTSSYVLNQIKESINIHRLYAPREKKTQIREFIRDISI
jgi:HD superfamily phosphohydrolase